MRRVRRLSVNFVPIKNAHKSAEPAASIFRGL